LVCPLAGALFSHGDLTLEETDQGELFCSLDDAQKGLVAAGLPLKICEKVCEGIEKLILAGPKAEEYKSKGNRFDWKDMNGWGVIHQFNSQIRSAGKEPSEEAFQKMATFMREEDGEKRMYATDFFKFLDNLNKDESVPKQGEGPHPASVIGAAVEAFGKARDKEIKEPGLGTDNYLTEGDLRRLYMESRYPIDWKPNTSPSSAEVIREVYRTKIGWELFGTHQQSGWKFW